MKTKLKTSSESKLEKLLKNNNFRNNQNYTFKSNFKKNIKFKVLIGILQPKEINGKISNALGYDKYKYINIFKVNNILYINSENYYIKQFFGYLLFLVVFGVIGYFMPIIGFLLFGFSFYLYIKGNDLRNEIKKLKFFGDNENIISVNNNVSKFIDDKVKYLDKKIGVKEIISEKIIEKNKEHDLKKIILNDNILNNQNYVFGRKMKNIVRYGMFTLIGKGKSKKVVRKSIIGLDIEEYKQDLENIIGFEKEKDFQYISYKYIKDNVGKTNGGLKILLIFFLIISMPFTLILLIFIFGLYGLLMQFLLFIGIIYFLFFHKYKFKGFGNFRVIYDQDLIYFIKK